MASRFAHNDIVVELVELCEETMLDISQQLNYYRASVYKAETAETIRDRIESLKLIVALLGDDMALEPIRDYEASELHRVMAPIPGECSFTYRVNTLLSQLNIHLGETTSRLTATNSPAILRLLASNVIQHRSQILSLCRHGSRQWAFFQTL